ncbi:MAG TPA: 50S ribosomal protein L15 [Sedimentisphaerales bacterium]|jgi:large subunit ribosomal protein L15|nr:50S ribosomal protein L15 [Phycisphaerae bacterium]HNS21205.1 50S ribosomal protein L15 [Sedimentisphaerales bacterium]HNU31006.1 50S ribosomal protein L15 [Sedimentisphaerales bacterium]
MLSHEITSVVGKHKAQKRVGRGRGSGLGKTAGRGSKGAMCRSGAKRFSLYQGGQIPLFRHLPKRGFNNKNFATRFEIVNVSELERFADGMQVGIEQLLQAGLVGGCASKVKILGDGSLTKKLQVAAHRFSKSAEQKILDCGGTATKIASEVKPIKRKQKQHG